MSKQLEDIDCDHRPHRGDSERIAQVWERYHRQNIRQKRWFKISRFWNHQIVGMPTIAWILLAMAGIAALNLHFGRPWF